MYFLIPVCKTAIIKTCPLPSQTQPNHQFPFPDKDTEPEASL